MKNRINIAIVLILLLVLTACQLRGEATGVVTTPQSGAGESDARAATPTHEHYIYGVTLEAKYSEEGLRYIHQDVLGSSRIVTDTTGVLVEKNTFLPYGESLGASEERFGFTGKEAEGDLSYYGARYYDSDTGKFTQADPIKDGRNWYTYAANNPLKYVDPNGLEEQKPIAVMIYNSVYPDFVEEVNAYKSNYKGRFEFITLDINGADELLETVNAVNTLVEEGRFIARVNYFDHKSEDIMMGVSRETWEYFPGMIPQPGRQTLMGTCSGGQNWDIFNSMTRVAGSESFVGTKGYFRGITRYPVDNDLIGLLVYGEVGLDIIEGIDYEEMAEFFEGRSVLFSSFERSRLESPGFELVNFGGQYQDQMVNFRILPSEDSPGLFDLHITNPFSEPVLADSTNIQWNFLDYEDD
ncbi:MAG: RHS repeat-associated core domain-containing protein [Candidatus Woesearchaeota archaeon]